MANILGLAVHSVPGTYGRWTPTTHNFSAISGEMLADFCRIEDCTPARRDSSNEAQFRKIKG
jgi:hypothetical protein